MPAVLISVVLHRENQCDYVRMLQTRPSTLHVALANLKGQTRALQIICSKALQLAKAPQNDACMIGGSQML